MTDQLGLDVRIIPTWTDITAKHLALLFFNHWYCENGLPKDIISDRDKLFVSKFWCTLHDLTRVKLKLSSSYHPQTDGLSECTNKMIHQCIQYHVCWNQKGWVHALPQVCFDIMNSINASTGFSNFQIHLGRSPRLIPLIIPTTITPPTSSKEETEQAQKLISQIDTDVTEVKDNLLQAKVFQAQYANMNRSPNIPFEVGDKVMLSTLHHHQQFKKKGEKWATKFFPCYDSLYDIIDTHLTTSNYTLKLPNSPNTYPMYHASELKPFVPNDTSLFPSSKLSQPKPILTSDGLEEFLVQDIIDAQRQGHDWQYWVWWVGYRPEHNHWLASSALHDCKALDVWLNKEVSGEATW